MQNLDRTSLRIWRWQRMSALILLPLVLFHVVYMYFVVGMDGISMETVSGRLKAAGFLILDIVLLVVVVIHAFAGIRGMLIDYQGDRRKVSRITFAIGILAAVTILYGLTALVAFL